MNDKRRSVAKFRCAHICPVSLRRPEVALGPFLDAFGRITDFDACAAPRDLQFGEVVRTSVEDNHVSDCGRASAHRLAAMARWA